MSGSYFLYGSILEKCGFILEKWPFFRADMAGLGKYCTGGYGRIGVYRVKVTQHAGKWSYGSKYSKLKKQ